ncbi:hypothetical protein CHUAL_007376 [Chamberlinius hualienensis]
MFDCWLILAIGSLFIFKHAMCNAECDEFDCLPFQECCEGKCCLNNIYPGKTNERTDIPTRILSYDYYSYSFWNVWYFWFIMIFLTISCVGGCGYWRCHRYHHHHQLSHHQIDSNRFQRERCNSQTHVQEFELPNGPPNNRQFPNSTLPPLRFIHHVGSYLHPPPYNEVTSKPDMYPLVQSGHEIDLSKNDPLAFVYANTNFIHLYMPYNSGAINYVPSPAESNASSVFQSTATSNFMSPPPYGDGTTYSSHQTRVSTPCSMLSACTPSSYIEPYTFTTHYLSTLSPPMATTPTSQQLFSEVTTPGADSTLASPTSINFQRYMLHSGDGSQLPNNPFTTSQDHLLTALVADIENMTNRSMYDAETNTSNNNIHHSITDNADVAETPTSSSTQKSSEHDPNAVDNMPRSRQSVVTSSKSGMSSNVSRDSLTNRINGNCILPHSVSLGSHELQSANFTENGRCVSDSHLT